MLEVLDIIIIGNYYKTSRSNDMLHNWCSVSGYSQVFLMQFDNLLVVGFTQMLKTLIANPTTSIKR